jgi:serine/threonine-protein kinase
LAGRYAIYGEIAAGGMATVHFARLFGTAGFSRTVAIKRLHAQLAKDPEFVAMFLDEAHLAARIRHPNVVPTLDVVSMQGEIFIVMEYVQGESLWRLLGIKMENTGGRSVPARVASSIVAGVLHGLHAAHEATNDEGEPLGIVHRDVSPQNVLVGRDGVARVLDFGIAKARDRIHATRDGMLKGKVSYMAPEQILGKTDRRSDVYAAGVVLWEALAGKKLFVADGDFAIADLVRAGDIAPPSSITPDLPPALDAIVMRALAKSPDDRFATAHEMAIALEREIGIATPSEVGAWVNEIAGDALASRAKMLKGIEKAPPQFGPGQTVTAQMDPDPDGLAPTRAIDVSAKGEATEVSLASSVTRPPKSGSTRLIAIGGGVIVAMGLAAAAIVRFSHRDAVVSPSVTSSASTGNPVASTMTMTMTIASTSTSTSASTSIVTPVVELAATVPKRKVVVTDPCNPPYVIDARGIRHLKHECLK